MDIFLAIFLCVIVTVPFGLFLYCLFSSFSEWVKDDAEYWREYGEEPTPLPFYLKPLFKEYQEEG